MYNTLLFVIWYGVVHIIYLIVCMHTYDVVISYVLCNQGFILGLLMLDGLFTSYFSCVADLHYPVFWLLFEN